MLRPYQNRAVLDCERELYAGKNTLCVMPTGCGKTVVFSDIIRRWIVDNNKGRVLVLAQRSHLLEQAYDKLINFSGFSKSDIDFEIGDRRAAELFVAPIVLGSKDSLHKRRRERFDSKAFSLIIIDEAHHAPAKTYKAVIDYFSDAVVLGVTATPTRHDRKSLSGIFDNVGFTYELIDAINDQYLVPIYHEIIPLSSVRLSDIKITKAGDFDEAELDSVMRQSKPVLQVARATLELTGARPTLIFCTSIQHAQDVADCLNNHRPNCARSISHLTKDQDQILTDYRNGRFQYLVNVSMITEGIDLPLVSCIIMAAPTMSVGEYMQRMGRGLRLLSRSDGPPTYAESIACGKENLYVIDFSGSIESITPVSVLDCLGGTIDDRVRKRVSEIGVELDVISALEQAEREIAERDRLAMIAERVTFDRKKINPFLVLGIPARPNRYGGAPLNDGQRELLLKFGVSKKDISKMDLGQAAELLREIKRRREEGLSTYRQSRKLVGYGINPDISFHAANKIITLIRETGWQLSSDDRAYIDYIVRRDSSRIF